MKFLNVQNTAEFVVVVNRQQIGKVLYAFLSMSQCLSIQEKVTGWQTAFLVVLVKGKQQCEKMNLNKMCQRILSTLKLNNR